MPRGCPPKKKRNISGLKNQPNPAPNLLPQIPEATELEPALLDLPDVDNEEELTFQFDMKDLASSEQEDDGTDSEFDEAEEEWKGLTSTELGKKLAVLSCRIDDDNHDHDWIPYKLRPQIK
jgi:hypothetical protein